MNSGISDSDSGQNTKMAGLSQNQCPVYRGMTVRVMPESVSGLLRNMQMMKKIHPNVIEILCNKYRLALKNAPTWNCKSAKNYFEYIMNAYLIENENKFLLQLRVIQQCFYHQIDTKTNWGKKQLVDLLNETLNKYQGE